MQWRKIIAAALCWKIDWHPATSLAFNIYNHPVRLWRCLISDFHGRNLWLREDLIQVSETGRGASLHEDPSHSQNVCFSHLQRVCFCSVTLECLSNWHLMRLEERDLSFHCVWAKDLLGKVIIFVSSWKSYSCPSRKQGFLFISLLKFKTK